MTAELTPLTRIVDAPLLERSVPRVALLSIVSAIFLSAFLRPSALAFAIASATVTLLGVAALRLSRKAVQRAARHLIGLGLFVAFVGLVSLSVESALGAVCLIGGALLLYVGAWLGLRPAVDASGARVSPARVIVHAAAGLDLFIELIWETESRRLGRSHLATVALDVQRAAARNRSEGWLAEAERAHPQPPELSAPDIVFGTVPSLGAVEQLGFASEFVPLDESIRDGYLAVEPNRTARVTLFRHRDAAGPRPTLVCVHGYGLGQPAIDAQTFRARGVSLEWLHRSLGLDVALFVLPFHGTRSDTRRSGRRFMLGHHLWTSNALAQSMWDIRRLIGWLHASGAPRVGIHGFSLGGLVAALVASVDERLACAAPMIPPVDLAHIAWEVAAESRQRAAQECGLTPQLLADAWAPCLPLQLQPRVPFEGRFLVASRFDRIVRPSEPKALWQHWGRPAMYWTEGTHSAALGRAGVRSAFERHLRCTMLMNQESQ